MLHFNNKNDNQKIVVIMIQLFKISFDIKGKIGLSQRSYQMVLLEDENNNTQLLDHGPINYNYGEIVYEEQKWSFFHTEKEKPLKDRSLLLNTIKNYHNFEVIIAAENEKEARKLLLEFIRYGNVPIDRDPIFFIRKKNIRKKIDPPISTKKLNFSNWPIKINLIEKFNICPRMIFGEDYILCRLIMEETRKEYYSCIIGSKDSRDYLDENEEDFCQIETCYGKEIKKYPIRIIEYKK